MERDLHIFRVFEANPILWDLSEMVAKANCLYYCAVLIRALMAVQLTQWASATAGKEKLPYIQKLVNCITLFTISFKHYVCINFQASFFIGKWKFFAINAL